MLKKISLLCKILVIILAILGVTLSMIFSADDGYSHPTKRLFYFTGQSNIWIAVCFILILLLPLSRRYQRSDRAKNFLYILKYILTISITLTGFIFCAVLAPGAKNDGYNAWTLSSILTHIIVPVLSITDFFLDGYKITLKRIHIIYTMLPPFLYLVFASILGASGFDFGRGDTFPYFFLNYASPAGFFGFSSEMPYIIGSFYWILIMLGIILGIGALYRRLYNKR